MKRGISTALITGLVLAGAFLSASSLVAQQDNGPLVLKREGRVIALVPYAPNILRLTMSIDTAAATGAPGYGIVAQPSSEGWTHDRDADGNDVYRSAQMVVRVAPGDLPADKLPQPMPLDDLNRRLRQQYFGGGQRFAPHNDALLVTSTDGRMLLHMRTWTMAPESAEVVQADPADKGYRVVAMFDSPADEHYYGLGQQQKGWMDLRDHEIRCWHDYSAVGGEDVCVPFMVSTRGYGLVWDNPSKTTVDLGSTARTSGRRRLGPRVVFRHCRTDQRRDLRGLSALTGVTHMLPRAVYGYIQSKAIYPTQAPDSRCGERISR
jgi:alpha-D-xyloside xylohydrolase